MFRVEVKHAFSMFIRKTQNEIKNCFKESVSGQEEQHYELHDKDVEEMAKKHNIGKEEGLPGNVSFQVRIVQSDKLVELHAFAFHQWNNPSTNNEGERTWGMLQIPLITQKEKEPLAEKFVARKIEFHLSISYIQKSLNSGKVFGKLKISNQQSNWVDINIL